MGGGKAVIISHDSQPSVISVTSNSDGRSAADSALAERVDM